MTTKIREFKQAKTAELYKLKKSKRKNNKRSKAVKNDEYDDEDDYSDDDVNSPYYEGIRRIKRKVKVPTNSWIIKPGENTNRGNGITVCNSVKDVKAFIGKPVKVGPNGEGRTFII